ncbi:MAG: ribonucleotide reductase N-terminal alpha domain-containing protein [Arhodomonas sp.]|nr:ribonucleotide reductase N-terminal alpha domain-containing protein [Arhodomonas sp.]
MPSTSPPTSAAVDEHLLDPRLLEFDLERLGRALDAGRDLQFGYLGLQTLYDRYLQHVGETRFELPQAFFMRVAMGLALEEIDREAQSETFYDLLSSFDFMSSTPTLFNAGTLRPQLSSCYLTTIGDDLDRIYSGIRQTTPCRPSSPGVSATTGPGCGRWGRTSVAPTVPRRAWCRSSRSRTTPPSR